MQQREISLLWVGIYVSCRDHFENSLVLPAETEFVCIVQHHSLTPSFIT